MAEAAGSGTPTARSTSTPSAASPSTRSATRTPKLVPALQDQIGKLIHSSNYYLVPLQEQLAAKLCELSGLSNVFFCNTGPRGQRGGAQDRAQVRSRPRHRAARDRRLRSALSTAARSPRSRPPATRRSRPASARWSRASCAFRSTTWRRSKQVARTNPNVVAVFLEVIQGEGGIRPTTIEYLQGRAPHLRRARLAADAGRSAVRHGPHRQMVRAPMGRHPAAT